MMLIRTRVGPSGIHGMGLFALEPVPRDTPVWRFLPGFDHDFSPEQVAALPPLAREHTRWFSFVRAVDGHAVLSGDHACFINHSIEPNTGAPPDAIEPVTTVALRDIAGGEEITCDYFAFDADAARKLGLVGRSAPLGSNPGPGQVVHPEVVGARLSRAAALSDAREALVCPVLTAVALPLRVRRPAVRSCTNEPATTRGCTAGHGAPG